MPPSHLIKYELQNPSNPISSEVIASTLGAISHPCTSSSMYNSFTNRWQSFTLYPGRIEERVKEGGRREREREKGGEGGSELLLAVSVLQIKMRIEVDEDLLTGLGGSYHPHALLGGRVGAGVARGGQVVRVVYLYSPPAFICAAGEKAESCSVSGGI